ncbi:transposable element Tcb2 transposase [Trichonephila clavipes]|nr:transposable element Tcb2 transposase [Trichonephila clavipes]
MLVWKQWTDKHRTTRQTGSWRRKGHDGHIRVRRYAGERCLSECVIERNSGLTPKVLVWGAISYHGQSDFQRIAGNLNSNSPTHATSSFACLFTENMSPIEHVGDLIGRRPAASYKQYGILFHKQTFKICSTSCHVV